MERSEYAVLRDFVQKHLMKIIAGIVGVIAVVLFFFGGADQAYIDCQWRGVGDMFNGTWGGNNSCLEGCRQRFHCLWPLGW